MRVKAIGRHLVVKMELDRVEKKTDSGIVIPTKAVESEEGGIQYSTVLDVGHYAFDDQPAMRDFVHPGTTVITTRYPGSALYTHTEWSDSKTVTPYRIITDTEVRAIVDESGALIDG